MSINQKIDDTLLPCVRTWHCHGSQQAHGKRDKPWKRGSETWITVLALCLICVGFALPFVWMLSTSLKTLDKTMQMPPHLIPQPWAPQNYVKVLRNPKLDFPLLTRNTLIVAVLAVTGTHDFQLDRCLRFREDQV